MIFFNLKNSVLLFFLSIFFLLPTCMITGQDRAIYQLERDREIKIISSGLGLLAVGTFIYMKSTGPDPAILNRIDVLPIERFAIDQSNRQTAKYSDITGG